MATTDSARHTSGWSLYGRVLTFGMLTVAAFMVLTGAALERSYRSTVLAASQDRLQARVFMVMSRTELDASGQPEVNEPMPEPALELPDSGAIAAISTPDGGVLWNSTSTLADLPALPPLRIPGLARNSTLPLEDGDQLRVLSYPVTWEFNGGSEVMLVFHAGESAERVTDELAGFRQRLLFWLGSAILSLLLLQWAMLRWLMKPLRMLSQALQSIETGQQDNLAGHYPAELQPLVTNLNALLDLNRQRLQRYRNSLADLAHTLKTPLAAIRASEDKPDREALINEQLTRMQETINWQLQRAAMAGRTPLAAATPVAPLVKRVADALARIYREKNLTIELVDQDRVLFPGDADDLTEILGNLIDNACKWATRTVQIRCDRTSGSAAIRLCVEDDGPGIPANLRDQVMLRGVRADTRIEGQGLGLSMVRDTVESVYGGEVIIGDSSLGGARICCLFPVRDSTTSSL